MNYRDYLGTFGSQNLASEFNQAFSQSWPQLNNRSNVQYVPGYTVYVAFLSAFPEYRTETVYVPRLDPLGRLLLALGALFDSPRLWNRGFMPEKRPKIPEPSENRLRVELQNCEVVTEKVYANDSYGHRHTETVRLQAGYCAYNDTLYVRKSRG